MPFTGRLADSFRRMISIPSSIRIKPLQVVSMKQTRFALLALLTLLTAGRLANAAEQKRAISHETLWLLKQVGAPAPSPDGRWVVVPVTEPAYDEENEMADLWI